MKRVPVESTVLRSVGYYDGSATLEIELISGRIYQYFDVPWDVHEELMASPSKGTYYNTRIKAGYDFREVEDPVTPSC